MLLNQPGEMGPCMFIKGFCAEIGHDLFLWAKVILAGQLRLAFFRILVKINLSSINDAR